ncbi:MAG: hypothetical protein H6765_09510 [Candidatus Peribacteria bacterium]|nr:MAG: hypothetical protein H6765_09510 [Candidatus Peribacteria bacterium]
MENNTRDLFQRIIQENQKIAPGTLSESLVVPFSDDVSMPDTVRFGDPIADEPNQTGSLYKILRVREGSGNEAVMQSLKTFLTSYQVPQNNEKACINLFTDEGIQDANPTEMLALSAQAKQKQVDIYINLLDEEGGVYSYTLDEYIQIMEKQRNMQVNSFLKLPTAEIPRSILCKTRSRLVLFSWDFNMLQTSEATIKYRL